MSLSAEVMMVLICGFIWGGFSAFLTRAIRREGDKQRVDE
ncbi:MAG: MetS family NSS transporter small subunit [Thermoanaerobaculia bacterium]